MEGIFLALKILALLDLLRLLIKFSEAPVHLLEVLFGCLVQGVQILEAPFFVFA